MSNFHYQDQQDLVLNRVDYSIVTHPNPVEGFFSTQFFRSLRAGVAGERVNLGLETMLNLGRETFELAFGIACELDSVGH